MRFLLVILAILAFSVAVSGIDTEPKNTLEANILNLLRKWRDGDKGPFSFPLPPLDEITLPAVDGKYEGYGAKISYATSELRLQGLKNFSVEELNASESKLKASGRVTVPSLTVYADTYNVKGRALWFIPVKGSGKLNVVFRDNQVTFAVRLRNNITQTWVDSLQLDFQVGSVKANLENGPSAINALLNNYGKQILQSNHDEIVKVVREQMVPVMDQFLKDMTPEQLFQTIASSQAPTVVQVK